MIDTSILASRIGGTTASQNVSNSNIDKQEFLQLLCTQLTYQDPTNPTSDLDFAAQLAQYSSLEQMQNMNNTMDDVKTMSSGAFLLGATVAGYSNTDAKDVSGVVDGIYNSNGELYVTIGDNILAVSEIKTIATAS